MPALMLATAVHSFDQAFDRAIESRNLAAAEAAYRAYRCTFERFAASRPETLADAADKLEILLAPEGDVSLIAPFEDALAGIAADLRKSVHNPTIAARLRSLRGATVESCESADAAVILDSVLAYVTRPRLVSH